MKDGTSRFPFQSLIGKLEAKYVKRLLERGNKFQSLIGKLEA